MMQETVQAGPVVDELLTTSTEGFRGVSERVLASVVRGRYVGHHGVLSLQGVDAGGSPVTVAKRNR